MEIYLIRHGQTEGNKDKRYLGITDEGLCEQGKAEIKNRVKEKCYLPTSRVFASPMKRCIETAAIIFPEINPIIVEDLRECDFGSFEYRNHQEMNGEKEYQEWIDSNGLLPFPGGESLLSFRERCVKSFLQVVENLEKEQLEIGKIEEPIVFVVHGGTIMALLSEISNDDKEYFNYLCDNGKGYYFTWEDSTCFGIQLLQ